MENIKWNKQLKNRIVSAGLSVVLVVTGYSLGKNDTKEIVSQALNDYNLQRSALEDEINNLTKQKEELLKQKEELLNMEIFDIDSLVVVKADNGYGQDDLYICKARFESKILREYHYEFAVIYNDDADWAIKMFPEYRKIDKYQFERLSLCLTEDEKEQIIFENNGFVTEKELDEILSRLRIVYKENKVKELSKKIN